MDRISEGSKAGFAVPRMDEMNSGKYKVNSRIGFACCSYVPEANPEKCHLGLSAPSISIRVTFRPLLARLVGYSCSCPTGPSRPM